MYSVARLRLAGLLAAGALVVSCGGGTSAPAPPQATGSNPGTAIEVNGRERLGWTQPATSIDGLHFAAYVDGSARTDLSATCAIAGNDAYNCDAALPPLTNGNHSLELVAWIESNGEAVESARSPALMLQVTNTIPTSATAAIAPLQMAGEPTSSRSGPPASSAACGLEAASDGQLVQWDATNTIRLVDTTTGRSRLLTWRTPDEEGWQIAGLAADPRFADNGLVYLAQLDTAEEPALRVARYRLQGDILGERAVLFRYPLTRRPARVRVWAGPGDALSIALLSDSTDARPHPFLIRLTTEGRIRDDNPRGSVFADLVAAQPVDVAWLPTGGGWLVERVRANAYALLLIRDGRPALAATFASTSPPVALRQGRDDQPPALWIALANAKVLGLRASGSGWSVDPVGGMAATPETISDAVLLGAREMAVCGPSADVDGRGTAGYRIWRVPLRE